MDAPSHARVLEGVAKSQSPLKAVVFKSQQPCPDTVSLDLDPPPALRRGVVSPVQCAVVIATHVNFPEFGRG